MSKPGFERGNFSSAARRGVRRAGQTAATGGGIVVLTLLNAAAARALPDITGGASAPDVSGGTAPAPGTTAPTGGASAGSESAMTAAQARLNAKAQRDANRLGWLAAGTNTSDKTVNFVPAAISSGQLAETTVTVIAPNKAESTPGEYTFNILSAVAKGKPDYNHTQQVVVSEGPANDPTDPYAQIVFNENPKTQAWSVEGAYTGSGAITIEAAAWPHPGINEAQLTTSQLGRAFNQAGSLIQDARFTTPLPVGYLHQAFPQPGNTIIPDL